MQAGTRGKDMSSTAPSSGTDATTPTPSTKSATLVSGDGCLTTIAPITENGITAGAAFRRAIISGYASITAPPTGSLLPDHKLAL